jgi:predicted PurR-regulated permease PerM
MIAEGWLWDRFMEDKKTAARDANKQSVVTWYYHPFFKWAIGILLVLIIILVFYHVIIFFSPVLEFISILFTPIVISLLFYYLLRPIVYFCERRRIPRIVTILCIYIMLAIAIIFFIAYIGPLLTSQIAALADTSLQTLEKVKESSQSLLFRLFHVNLNYEIEHQIFNAAQQVTQILSKNLGQFLAYLTHLAATLAVIPFIVFYLLKDDHDFASILLRNVPADYALEIRKTWRNMDQTLSNYITGLILVSSSVGALLFIGYLIIGLNYALILSLLSIIFMTIPFLGPFLAISPALLVGLSMSSWMVVKVIIIFLIVQQCEANILSPQIIGQRLHIHPLTIILLLLVGGSLYGLAGLILATPVYALAKVLIENLYKIYQWHYVYSRQHSSKNS